MSVIIRTFTVFKSYNYILFICKVMSMIDIKNFTKTPMERLKKLNPGDRIELLTYKRDRKVVIKKIDDYTFDVSEDGFMIEEFPAVEISALVKLLKHLQKTEFPRSNKFFLEILPPVKSGNKHSK